MRLSGGPARATAVLSVPLALLTASSLVGTVLAPHLLVANPLVLVVLAPRTLYLTVAAGRVPLGLFLVVGLLRLAAADPSHYLLGRLHGPRLTELAQRRAGSRRMIALGLRAWHRIGLPIVALSPSGKFLVLAGASGMPHRRVAAAALGGTLVQLLALYAAGRAVAGPADALASLAAEHAAVLVLVTAAAMVTVLVRAALRRRPRPDMAVGEKSAGDERGLAGVELDAAAVELLEQHPLAPCAP